MKKLAVSALAVLAMSSAWAITGTLQTDKGTSAKGDIRWNGRTKMYTVVSKKGGSEMESQYKLDEVDSLDIDKPAGLDKAIELVRGGQGAAAIAPLTKIVADYKMLNWDKPAARYLVLAYLAANNGAKAFETAQSILADDKDAAYTGEFAPSYWQVLLKLGKTQQLENCLKKAASSGDRASSAEALNMRGDIILAQGGDSPDSYRQALTDGYLRVALMYVDDPCREARFNALQKSAQCFDKLGQAIRAEQMRSLAKAL